MNKQAAFLSLYRKTAILFPVLGAALGISYFLAMRLDFEPSIGHFARGSVPALTAWILTALSVILAAALAFASRKAVSVVRVPEKNPLTAAAAILGTLSAAAMLIFLLIRVFDPLTGFAPGSGRLAFAAEVSVIFLIPALLLTVFPAYDVSDVRAFFWIMSACALLLSLFACYFNYENPLNSPVRNLTTLMQVALLLLLLAESRLALDPSAKKTYVTAPFQIFATAVSSSAGFGVALGGILDSFFNPGGLAAMFETPLYPDNPNLPVLRLLLYLGLALFGMSRLFALPKAAGTYRPPLPEPKKKTGGAERSPK